MRSTAIHDTLSKGSFSWIYLIILIIKLTYYSVVFAQPQGKQMPDRDTRVWKPFLVDLKINQQKVGSAFVWQHEDGKDWLLPVDVLQRSRVRIPSTVPRVVQERIEYVSIASLGKVDTHFSEEILILSINLASNAFEASSIKVPIHSLAGVPSMAAGTVINYDLSLASGMGRSTEFFSTELSTGIGMGVFVASQAYLHDGQNDRFIRLDTNYTLDQPEKLATLRLGDAISRPATTLGRSVRFAGIQYGSNFRVQPGLITAPLASLSGQAAVPSMVDLYINNVLQSSQAVPPGPFSITAPPMIAGDGEIVMKIRDISGREELISGRFYSTPYLLAPGLSEFSFEAGTLRNNYGLPEDRYNSLFSSASYRRGITEKFTAEIGAQGTTDGPKNILLSGIRTVPSIGLFNLAVGVSNSDVGTGSQFAAGFERRSGPMSVSFRTEHANDKFQQTGIDTKLVMRRLDNAFWNYRFDGLGNLGLSYTHYQRAATPATQVFGISFSTLRSWWGSAVISAYKTEGPDKNYSIGLFWIIPTSRDLSASLLHSATQNGSPVTVLQAQKSPPYGEGIGWRLQTAINAAQQASVVKQSRNGVMYADVANYQDSTSGRVGLSGALVNIDEQWFMGRRISSSYGVVKLPELSNVRVYVNNQLTARTDELGYALLPNLHPYIKNHVSVEQLDLPLDTKIDSLLTRPVPMWRRGVIVKFPIRKISAATLRIVDEQGVPIPVGASAQLEGSLESFVVGRDGLAYIEDLQEKNVMVVSWPENECRVKLPYSADEGLVPYLGEFECKKEKK